MAGDPIDREKVLRPELILQEILRKGAKGSYQERDESVPFLHRALVLAVDVVGEKLENPDANGSVSHNVDGKKYTVDARGGPKNPPNSIKARVLSDGLDKFVADEDLRVFWPFFPENISVPVKPGEHVYVVFEDAARQHGLWVSKVPGHTEMNYALGKSFYKPASSANLASKFPDTDEAAGSTDERKFDKDEDAAETKPGNKLSSLFT